MSAEPRVSDALTDQPRRFSDWTHQLHAAWSTAAKAQQDLEAAFGQALEIERHVAAEGASSLTIRTARLSALGRHGLPIDNDGYPVVRLPTESVGRMWRG